MNFADKNINNILVTGSTGLLGSKFTRDVSEYSVNVYAVVKDLQKQIKKTNLNYLKIDLASDWPTSALPTERIDTVIHLAQSSHFRDFPKYALDIFNVNVATTAKLLEFAQKNNVKRFIYTSSGGIYGKGSSKFNENSPLVSYEDLGYYLGSKLCSEVLVQSYAPYMDITILRPFFMYGRGQRRSMLIPRLVDKIKNRKPISLQGKGGIRLNPVHVSDAATLLNLCLLESGNRIINVAGPDVLSLKEISEIIGEKIGIKPKYEYVSGTPRDLIGNNSLMKEIIKRPMVNFFDGVEDVL